MAILSISLLIYELGYPIYTGFCALTDFNSLLSSESFPKKFNFTSKNLSAAPCSFKNVFSPSILSNTLFTIIFPLSLILKCLTAFIRLYASVKDVGYGVVTTMKSSLQDIKDKTLLLIPAPVSINI